MAVTVGDGAREVIENTRGRWLVELAELVGRSNREIEAIRKFITVRTDTARGAYKHRVDDVPRQFVFYATTNADEFLDGYDGQSPLVAGHLYRDRYCGNPGLIVPRSGPKS